MPFERFSRERLELVLAAHPVTPEGRKYIESALSAPSRNVQGTTRNVVSDLPCPKMGGNAQSESWSDENRANTAHVFDPNVVGYTNQVPRLELIYQGRNGRRVRAPYTGDCLRFDLKEGVVLEEWKPASDRGKLEEKFPGKYRQLESGDYISEPIANIVNPMGIKFAVRFSDEISTTAHRNRCFLYSYLQPRAAIHGVNLQSVLSEFNSLSYRTYADLADSGVDKDVLNWAIAYGHLHIDFDSALISAEPSLVNVFRDDETLSAWKLSIRPDGTHPSVPETFAPPDLRPGDAFIFDGRRLKVSMDGISAIYAVDERQQHVVIDLQLLIAAMRAGKAVLPSKLSSKPPASRFWRASPAALSRAIKRFGILQILDKGEVPKLEDRYSPSTIRRWCRAVREGELIGISPVEALLDCSGEKGFRGSHVDSEFDAQLTAWIEEAISDKKCPSTHAIYFSIKKKAELVGYTMVAKSSFYERVAKVRSFKTIRNSQGHKVAYQVEPLFWMLEQTTPVHCERALELVHFDSTLLDIELRSSISGEILGRPWLSIAVCAFSRRVVGMYLSFRPPSYVSSMMLLADIVRRFGRLPDAIIHDWGSEFKAKDWKNALTSLFITRHTRPKSAPRFGSVLERLFGIVTRELIDNVAGNTKLRKQVRQITPATDASSHSGLWMADLYAGLEEFFFVTYEHRKHPTTLVAPRASFDSSLITHGQRLHRVRRYEDILSILMPCARGRPRTIDPARGIFVNYRYYGNPLLASLNLAGTTTLVKPIPFDPGVVLAFLKGNWIVCRSALSEELQRAPEIVRRCLFEEWVIEQRLVRDSHDGAREKVQQLIESLNEKALKNIEYWKDRTTHDFLSTADFSFAPTDQGETNALTRLDAMMKSAIGAAMNATNINALID